MPQTCIDTTEVTELAETLRLITRGSPRGDFGLVMTAEAGRPWCARVLAGQAWGPPNVPGYPPFDFPQDSPVRRGEGKWPSSSPASRVRRGLGGGQANRLPEPRPRKCNGFETDLGGIAVTQPRTRRSDKINM